MSKVKVIVINGVSRSGKDTFIDFLRTKVYVLVKHSTIDVVLGALTNSIMMDHKKKGREEREFLATVKQAWIMYNDGPFKQVVDIADDIERTFKFQNNVDRVLLVVQVREPDEIQKLSSYFGVDFHSVLVRRKDTNPQHPTDVTVEEWDYDYIVFNDGTLEQLEVNAQKFIAYMRKEK